MSGSTDLVKLSTNYDPKTDEPLDGEKFREALKKEEDLKAFLDKLLDKFKYLLEKIDIPKPVSSGDITKVQLEDMTQKIEVLKDEVASFKNGNPKDDSVYRRLTETCVKFSIQLDRINVIGRDKERDDRKKMLIEVDKLSTELVQIHEQHKNTKH
ncbi:unnamed protein product [Allacma fusca]|uniref:BAG domain-containing protein n=1 Tax=Allacma fusca TaxID=39272 RepID=A0A8J2L7S5_9HEXA|nr:unnamed protein product [Allacma fusca]